MERARVVTLNLWGEQPPLVQRMQGVLRELTRLAPDVVLLQEVRQVPGVVENQAHTLASQLGMSCAFAVATPWGGGEEGLAILSRLPITREAAHELPGATPDERRILLHAELATPRGALHAFTTHLNYRMQHGAIREAQVAAAAQLAAAAISASDLPALLGGDFNATPDSDEMRYLRGLHSIDGRRVYWQDAWRALHDEAPGYTWSRKNPHTERLKFLTRDRRIDYLYVSAERRDGRALIHDCGLAFVEPDAAGCHPSDHFGLYADVQLLPLG